MVTVAVLAAIGAGEVTLRHFFSERLFVYNEERVLLYRYDERLGWFPRENIMSTFVGRQGGVLVVGLVEPQAEIEYFLRAEEIPFVMLSGAERYTDHGRHWTPEGHTTVSNAVYTFLRDTGNLSGAGRTH